MPCPASRWTALLLAGLLAAPQAVSSNDEAAGSSRLEGTVRDADGEAVAGVRVILVPLGEEGPVRSATTDGRGRYELDGLPHGYYRCALVHEGRAYPGNRVLLVPPGEKVKANWTIGPATARDRMMGLEPEQPVPAAGGVPAAGVAHLEERLGPTGLRWLTTGRGATLLLGGATAIIAGIIALSGGDETAASPSSP